MNVAIVRLFASPALDPAAGDGLVQAWQAVGRLTPVENDADLDLTAASVILDEPEIERALQAGATALAASAPNRILWFDAQAQPNASGAFDESRASDLLAQTLNAPVYVARRSVPASAWTTMRPAVFRVDGLAIQATQPTVTRPGSASRGVVLELGHPTIVVKLGLHGVPANALQRMCNAVGSAAGGLLHIGAYPAISKMTGERLLVLECTDPAKSPLERALDLVDIEARRYGGALGSAKLLSAVPLQTILETLAARLSLDAQPAQIIETHLAKPGK